MRDKVKRFLSILMTALMLVNLLPVGALAEGVMISNSVQSKESLTADSGTAPIETGHVYVYVKIDGASPETLAKFKLNSSGWYTIGSIRKDMPGKGEWKSYWYGGGEWVITPTPSDTKTYQPGDNTGAGELPAYSIVGLKPWEDNKLIPLGNVRWTGYKLTTGANNYQPESIFSWHMDGIVNFKEINVPYTVKHVVKDSSPEIVLKEETKNQKYGQMTDATKLKFEGYKHVGKIENQIIGDDPITIYVYYEPDKKQTVDVTYKTSEGGTITNGRTYKIQPVTGNLSGGGRLPIPIPTAADGYEFAGWERDDGQTYNDLNDVYSKLNQKTADAGTYTLYQNTTFTAKFTKKANLSYTVNYLEKGTTNVLHEAKTVENQTFGAEITSASEKIDISGYNYDSASPETLTIQADESKNVINLYYTKKTDLSYTVNYYWNGTNPLIPIKNSESGTGTYGKTVNPDTDVPGYTLVPGQTTSLEIKDDPDQPNVLNLYYYKNVKLKANDTSRVYNGAKQTILSSEEYTVITTLDNQVVETTFDKEINVTGSGTDVGSNYTMYFPKKEIGIHNEQYYVVGYENGKLSITKRPVTLTSGSAERVYNGEALTKNEVTASTGENEGFVKGQGATYDVTGSQTDVGTSNNTFTYTLNKGTKADNYSIELVLGKLEVTPVTAEVIVTITGRTAEMPYDGKEHSVFGYDVTVSNALYNPKKDMQFNGIDEDMTAKGIDAGTYPMELTAEDFTNISDNFSNVTFVVTDGYVKINPRTVTLTSETAGKTYDGTALTKPEVAVGGDGFVDGEVTDIKATGSVTYVSEGEVTNTITYTEGEKFKADNYTIEKNEGKLSINPVTDKVTVTITENSDTVTYDGGDHIVSGYASMTADNELYDVDASVQETPTAAWTVKGKDAGEYPVGIKADDFKNTNGNFTNVKFVVVDGKLTITPAPVTLQAPIQSKTYDGTPLEATQFGHSYLEGVNFADDFAAVILTGSQTLVGSSASLITGVIPNEGKKLTNYNFTFVPGTLTITDGTGEEEKPVDPAKVITKTHIPKDMGYNLGEPVTFTISVKNIYNTPKTITLTEKENVKFSNGENVIVFKDVPAGETVTAEATYTITSADILEGVFHNTVTADFTGGGSWTAEDTVTTAELDTTLNVTKTSDVPEGQKAALGQTITYTIKVQNAGNVPYTNVVVEDPLTKLTATIETLPVGETRTFTTEYVVTEADVLKGSVLNTATATGDKIKDPKGDEQKEPNGGDEVETPTFAPITIKPKDVTATYNGAAITGKDVEITSGKLLEGHKLSAAVIGSGVNAGSYELTLDPEKIKIVDANNKDVSEMYARTILPGKLIINKRSVRITSQSATKTYDGSALTSPAVTITGDGFVPGELAKAEATGSITNVGSTPNAIQYTTTGAFNAANYSIALSVGTLTVTEKPKPEPRRTFNLTINYVYQNGKRAAASYNRGGLKNGETFDITSPVIAGYTASETVVSGTIYNRDIKVTVIYTADGVNLDDYGVPLGLGNITMNVGDCFE